MTMFRSAPCGLGGVGGNSPAAMRSVQSANIGNARSGPSWPRPLIMLLPACPESMRRAQAAVDESKMAQALWNLVRGLVAHLMTRPTAIGFQNMQPLTLAFHVFRDAIAFGPGAGELAFVRHTEQGKPINGRVVFRCCTRVRRHCRSQIDNLARHRLRRRGIHEPVAAHPYLIVDIWKLR